MTTKAKRDLTADLALCEAATPGPWIREPELGREIYSESYLCGSVVTVVGDDMSYVDITPNNERFILEAREGWPHAIRRAIEAEAKVDRLRKALETARHYLIRNAHITAEIVIDRALLEVLADGEESAS